MAVSKKLLSCCILILLLMSGCSTTREKSADLKSVIDSTGVQMKVLQKPQRIVSMTIGTDEIVMDLVAPERIAALSSLADDPGISYIADRSAQVPRKISNYSAESLIALQPDLVLIADWWQPNTLEILRKSGIAVYTYKTPITLSEIKTTVAEIAAVVGEPEAGARIIANYEQQLAAIQTKLQTVPTSERKSLLTTTNKSGFGGASSVYADMCRYANINNALGNIPNSKVYTMSKENIVAINPEIIITCIWNARGMVENQRRDEIISDPAFQSVKAIQNRQVIELDGKYIYCNSHYIAYSLQKLAAAIYPQYFVQ